MILHWTAQAKHRPSRSARPSEMQARISSMLTWPLHVGSSSGRCLYVSGVPGTGKTATVMETIRSLRRKAEAGKLPAFQFVDINSLRLPSPQHAYTQLYEVCIHQLIHLLSAHLFIAFYKGCNYALRSSREDELQFCLGIFPISRLAFTCLLACCCHKTSDEQPP